MKLLLLQPPIEDFYDTDIRLQPLGLASLKAAVRKFAPGIEVRILDFHHGWGRRTVALPRQLAYLREYYALADRSPFGTFCNFYRFGATDDQIVAAVKRERPDLVGISFLFTAYFREALRMASTIKQATGVPIVAGGCHVSAAPESVLACPDIDFIIRGEGERPLVSFLGLFRRNRNPGLDELLEVPGLGFRANGRAQLNPVSANFSLDELPAPDLEDLPPENYLFDGLPMTFLLTSRGCPHRCSFCSVHSTFGAGYRSRGVERVLEELHFRFRQGYRVIDFEDDNLTFHREEMEDICRRIIREFPEGSLRLAAMNGISYLSLDSEMLGLMWNAGFRKLNLSLVSSDETVLKTAARPHTVERFSRVVGRAYELGFRLTAYQILGLPQDSLEGMVRTMAFLASHPVLIGPSVFYVTPDMPVARELGLIAAAEDPVRARSTALSVETSNFDRGDLFTLFISARILNFLKTAVVGSGNERSLDEVLSGGEACFPSCDPRSVSGCRILEILLREGVLYADTRRGFRPVKKFQERTFQCLRKELGTIRTLDGGTIRVERDASSPGCTSVSRVGFHSKGRLV